MKTTLFPARMTELEQKTYRLPDSQSSPKRVPQTPIRGQNSSRDHEFSGTESQFQSILELQVDENDHNPASDDAHGGPNSSKIARH